MLCCFQLFSFLQEKYRHKSMYRTILKMKIRKLLLKRVMLTNFISRRRNRCYK